MFADIFVLIVDIGDVALNRFMLCVLIRSLLYVMVDFCSALFDFCLFDFCSVYRSPHWLTFTWLGCYDFCQRHKPTELAQSFFFCSCFCFCLCGPFNCISFHKFSRQLSRFLTLFFRSYLRLLGPFNYISLYESLLQHWYDPLWLTGLKTPIN